ncbi:cyclin-dependent kinase 4 inhibitor C-like [Nasonia vitripennis]|uniref:Uncharacterized protein n=1 Tax=Nasonia vitripennis TaxID=7425 RepID=A0A7M7Q5A1_NASVI|nr:cyclin-dependent kinase 4 inhibitor C-like [Nasonia vitripennis]
MLLERNVNPYIKTVLNDSITTVLHVAVLKICPEMLEIILTHNVNVNEPNDFGQRALQILFERIMMPGFSTMIRLLLSKGATLDLNKLDSRGNTVLHRLLQNKYFPNDDEDLAAAVRYMSSLNDVVNWQNSDGKTPLHLAAENGKNRVLEILLPTYH